MSVHLFRTTDIVIVIVMVAAAAFTYTTKHGAEAELAKARQLEAQIRLERDAIDILRADWSLLTQPSRLQRLADAYTDDLMLYPVEPYQYADLSELPPVVLQVEDVLLEALGSEFEIDGTITGGVSE